MYGSDGEDFERMVCTGYDAFMRWDGQLKKEVGLRKTKYAVQTLLWYLKVVELLIDFITILLLMVSDMTPIGLPL